MDEKLIRFREVLVGELAGELAALTPEKFVGGLAKALAASGLRLVEYRGVGGGTEESPRRPAGAPPEVAGHAS